jgi:hypothetical protein
MPLKFFDCFGGILGEVRGCSLLVRWGLICTKARLTSTDLGWVTDLDLD